MVLNANLSTMANIPPWSTMPLHHSIYEDCEMIVDDTMQSCIQKLPFDWQKEACCHLLWMQLPHSGLLPSVVLLVAPTGGGKSHVHVVAAAYPGVILSIWSPLLMLGEDQESNLNLGPVTAFHVDEILNDKKKQEEVIKMCLDSDFDNVRSITLLLLPRWYQKTNFGERQLAIASDMTNSISFVSMRFICFALWYVILKWVLWFERKFVWQNIGFWSCDLQPIWGAIIWHSTKMSSPHDDCYSNERHCSSVHSFKWN